MESHKVNNNGKRKRKTKITRQLFPEFAGPLEEKIFNSVNSSKMKHVQLKGIWKISGLQYI